MGSSFRIQEQAKRGRPANESHKKMKLAENELAKGNLSRAIGYAKAAIRVDNDHVGALEILAKAQWQASLCNELLLTLGRLIELNPYEPGYHSLLANAYQSLGFCGEAVRAYQRAIDLGVPKSDEMESMIEDLRVWQGSLVSDLMATDAVFQAAYAQDPFKACAAKGFDFAIPAEAADLIVQERQSRAVVSLRRS